jgi:hypothetical protein
MRIPEPRAEWMIEQGARCGCGGADDMCACQNEHPWPPSPLSVAERHLAAIRDLLESPRHSITEKDRTWLRGQLREAAGERSEHSSPQGAARVPGSNTTHSRSPK